MDEVFSIDLLKKNLNKSIDFFQLVLGKIREGDADTSLIRTLEINYYDSRLELYQIASITIPKPRLIQIKPYNKSDVKIILKAIQESNLNLNPIDTEDTIRIVLAPLTTDQKLNIIKQTKKETEKAKVTIRNLRRRAMDEIIKNKELSENEKKLKKKEIERVIQEYNKLIVTLLKKKIDRIEAI